MKSFPEMRQVRVIGIDYEIIEIFFQSVLFFSHHSVFSELVNDVCGKIRVLDGLFCSIFQKFHTRLPKREYHRGYQLSWEEVLIKELFSQAPGRDSHRYSICIIFYLLHLG